MGGRYRKNLTKGLHVAIVLKEDQRSGKLTYGNIGNLLSPGDFHPRGIKVRLSDGQVGRVQQILPQVSKTIEDKLLVLVIKSSNQEFYCRKLITDSGEEVYSLGVDKLFDGSVSAIKNFCKEVTGLEGLSMINLIKKEISIADTSILIDTYLISADTVYDDQKSYWSWVGWLELEKIKTTSNLSPETEVIIYYLKNFLKK